MKTPLVGWVRTLGWLAIALSMTVAPARSQEWLYRVYEWVLQPARGHGDLDADGFDDIVVWVREYNGDQHVRVYSGRDGSKSQEWDTSRGDVEDLAHAGD